MALMKNIEYIVYETDDCLDERKTVNQKRIYPNAYIRIDAVRGSKKHIELFVNIYENRESDRPIISKLYDFSPSVEENSKNFIAQGYEYLKTLPEFSDAVDC